MTASLTVSGLTPRLLDQDAKSPVTVDVNSSTDYDLTDAHIAFAYPPVGTRPTTWTFGEAKDATAQHFTGVARAVTHNAGTYDVYSKVLAGGHTFVRLVGRLHVH